VTIPTLVLTSVKRESSLVDVNGASVPYHDIEATMNLSWAICSETLKFFRGALVGDFILASSGMTTGNNEIFVKELVSGNQIVENYTYEYFDEPITLEGELSRARLGKLSRKKIMEIEQLQRDGATRKTVRVIKLDSPSLVPFPHPSYKYYNKACSERFFSPPKYAIYWENDGDAVLTYKKAGPWYLHGVGGAKFFQKEGLTWSLVSSRFAVRYLPQGYILDSGAPLGILRQGVDQDELYFIIGWLNTSLARSILKTVINHTRNIQSKDVERLPYPFWVDGDSKKTAISITKDVVHALISSGSISERALQALANDLEELYSWREVDCGLPDIVNFKQLELVA